MRSVSKSNENSKQRLSQAKRSVLNPSPYFVQEYKPTKEVYSKEISKILIEEKPKAKQKCQELNGTAASIATENLLQKQRKCKITSV